ncbi:Hypothetical predicted protein [Cloeon dipterum]|nr:Hypothetical predicted protein [Cloeon dipterum]
MKEKMCNSTECMISANRIINSMDSSVDPCEDFFQFACGGFIKDSSVNHWHQRKILELDSINVLVLERLLKLLVGDSKKYPFLQKAREKYRNCTTIIHPHFCLKGAKKSDAWLLGVAYAREYPETADEFRRLWIIVDTVYLEFRDMVAKSTWMDEESIKRSIIKAAKLDIALGYDPYILKKHRFRFKILNMLNPLLSAPVHWPEYAIIFLPLTQMNPPIYKLGHEVLEYGAMGAIFAHELTHSYTMFDYDGDGKKNFIWSPNTISAFYERVGCFVAQYNEEFRNFIEIRKDEIERINSTRNVFENIADSSGLRAAFRTFKWKENTIWTLKGLEDFSPEQLFFLAHANLHCTKEMPHVTEETILKNKRTPFRFRVNVPMKNMDEFAKAWHCPLGSNMNPVKKCVIW